MANMAQEASSIIHSRQLITSLVDELAALQATATASDSNPLAHAEAEQKNILLTLYAAFPKELPFALDLLDRRLIHCFTLQHEHDEETKSQAQDRPQDSRLGPAHLDRLTGTHTDVDQAEARHKEPEIDANESVPAPSEAEVASTEPDHGMQQNSTVGTATDKEKLRATVKGVFYVRSAQHHARSRYRNDNPVHYEVRLRAWSCSCPAFSLAVFPPTRPPIPQQHTTQTASCAKQSFGGLSFGDELPLCKHLLACYLADKCSHFRSFVEERAVTISEMAAWAAGWGE